MVDLFICPYFHNPSERASSHMSSFHYFRSLFIISLLKWYTVLSFTFSFLLWLPFSCSFPIFLISAFSNETYIYHALFIFYFIKICLSLFFVKHVLWTCKTYEYHYIIYYFIMNFYMFCVILLFKCYYIYIKLYCFS